MNHKMYLDISSIRTKSKYFSNGDKLPDSQRISVGISLIVELVGRLDE